MIREYKFPLYGKDEEKEKFYDEYMRIKETCKSVDFRWSGDYTVVTYVDAAGREIEVWDNEELGICHSIVYLNDDEDIEEESVQPENDNDIITEDVHFPLSEEDRLEYYYKTVMLGSSIPFELYKIGDKYYDVNGTELDSNGKDLKESKSITEDIDDELEKGEETVYDLISNRIGEDITVGELNTILQSIFGKYDDIFLLHNDLYNADTDEPQDLVIWDDDDMYTITFDIVDMEEGIIEITDVSVE